jgi:hypothetical protein
MKLLFCHDPLADKQADALFIDEAHLTVTLGMSHHLIDYDALKKNNLARAVRNIPMHKTETLAVYRGWALSERHYDLLYEALLSRGVRLINTPQEYTFTHYQSESLDLLSAHTPPTHIYRTDSPLDFARLSEWLSRHFGDKPIIVKDNIRSQKHYWNDACYISSASDSAEVQRVVTNFLNLQGSEYAGALVFREFVHLKALSDPMPNIMPFSLEYRLVYLEGHLITVYRYWDAPEFEHIQPPLEQFATLAQQVPSRFFTMDIAQKADGSWIIFGLGDAQVNILPQNADAQPLYHALSNY